MKGRAATAAALTLFLLMFLALPAGCGRDGGAEISTVELVGLALQDSFALYYPVPAVTEPRVPSYAVSADLSGVAGAADLPRDVRGMLGAQGFAAVTGKEGRMYEIYLGAAGAKYVTVEAMLHTFRAVSSYALRDAEETSLAGDLTGLVGATYEAVERMHRGCRGAVREAALADLAYLGVAARLLGLEVAPPPEVEAEVEEEVAYITGASGSRVSAITGTREDYSRYAPRGYYADGGELARYFQASTWLARKGFYPRPGKGPADVKAGRDMTRQALILVGALHVAEVEGEPAYAIWDRIYQANSFLASSTRDLNPYLYTRLARELLGQSFSLNRLQDDALIDGFIERALAERPPVIVSAGGAAVSAEESAACFRLLGERALPDGYIFQKLAAPQVPERPVPRCLDLPAAVGSDRALHILDLFYNENAYQGYRENMENVRALLKNVDPVLAHSDLYWSGLDVIRLMLRPCGEGYPAYMRAAAWEDRCLYGFLGSWADLRHYEVEYAEPAALGPPAGTAGTVAGYVEPMPEAFARLAAAADVLRRGMDERGLASPALRERLDKLYDLLLALKVMAEKELRNQPLDGEEHAVIAGIGETMRYLVTFPARGTEGSFEERASTILADVVYGDPGYGEALQAAVGRPVTLYVIAPVGGKPTLTVGAGYSFYEFVKPSEGTLSDQSWREAVEAGLLPGSPAWSASFLRD